jgi:hypothetical protein
MKQIPFYSCGKPTDGWLATLKRQGGFQIDDVNFAQHPRLPLLIRLNLEKGVFYWRIRIQKQIQTVIRCQIDERSPSGAGYMALLYIQKGDMDAPMPAWQRVPATVDGG